VARYSYAEGDHALTFTAPRVTRNDIRRFLESTAEFALVVDEPVVFICAKVGDLIPWVAAEVAWDAVPRDARRLPPPAGSSTESRALLQTTLVDGTTGQTVAIRNVTLWLDFTRALHDALRDQARSGVDPREYRRVSGKLRLRCPNAQALVSLAGVRSMGSP